MPERVTKDSKQHAHKHTHTQSERFVAHEEHPLNLTSAT